jgi:RNA polymerase sigma factor (sigma-70 family)
MIIPSIGKQKIKYKDHSGIQFESLDFYLNLSQKIIAKLAPTFFSGLSKEMLKNEDAVSFVANAIMMGDWRWEKSDEKKQNKTLYSYRNQCAIWAIKTYITKKYKLNKNKKKSFSMSSFSLSDDDALLTELISDKKQKDPIDILIKEEENTTTCSLVHELLNTNILTEKQKDHIKLYFLENYTLEKIGEKYDVTREAIRQSIKSSIKKIRELV